VKEEFIIEEEISNNNGARTDLDCESKSQGFGDGKCVTVEALVPRRIESVGEVITFLL
jgi:mannose-6-phosphate isomerase-like protein (cupin superfamily)